MSGNLIFCPGFCWRESSLSIKHQRMRTCRSFWDSFLNIGKWLIDLDELGMDEICRH
jgi:hypothetical protein